MTASEFSQALETAKTPDEVRSLLMRVRARFDMCLVVIAQIAKVWDDALVQLLLVRNVGSLDLLSNPNRPPNAEVLLIQWAVNRLLSENARESLDSAYAILGRLIRLRKLAIDSREARLLLSALRPRRDSLTARQIQIVRLFLQHPDIDEGILQQMLDITRDTLPHELVSQFVLHPRANTAIRLAALGAETRRVLPSGFILDLFNRADLRTDPALRPRLVEIALAFKELSPRLALLEDANPNDCATLLRAILADNPADAASALQRSGDRLAPYLAQDDVSALLRHSDRTVRAAAIARLGSAEPAVDRSRATRI